CRKLQPLLLPLGRDRKPIDAAAFDDNSWPQLSGREEQPLKARVAKIFRSRRALGPRAGEKAQKMFAGISDPNTRFRSKPVEPAQPKGSWFQARIVQEFRLVRRTRFGFVDLPIVSVPYPYALIALTSCQ